MDETVDSLLAKLEADLSGASPETPAAEVAPETPAVEPTAEQPAEPAIAPVAEVTQEPATEVQPVESAEEAPAPAETKIVERFRTKQWNEVDRLAATITAESEGKIPLEDALAQAKQMLGKVNEPAVAAPDPIAALEAEQAEIAARLDAASEEGSVITRDIRKDQKREAELTLEIHAAKQAKLQAAQETERQQAAAADTEFDRAWNEDVAEVVSIYGDTAKDDGALGKAMLDEFDVIAKTPTHRFHAQWQAGMLSPLTVAPYVAAKRGILPAAAAPVATPAAPTTPAAPVARVLPVSGGARTAPAPIQNAATAQAALEARLKSTSNLGDIAALYDEQLSPGASEVMEFTLA